MIPLAPAAAQRRDQHVDLALGNDGLDREPVLAEELRDGGRLQCREQRDDPVEADLVDVELQEDTPARLERSFEEHS